MASLNKVMLIGNLTRDPELKYTPKGLAVADLGLAVNRRFVVEGEKREEVAFIDVTYFGKAAEIISQYMKKGNPLFVEGRLKLDTWDDKSTGQKRSKLTVIGDEFQFLGGKADGGSGGGQYDDSGSSRSSGGTSGGGYSQNRPPQAPQQRSQENQDYDDSPPPRSSAPPQPRPDAFPSGLDDDEIPF
jgi:single-strand DNA-binding protein